MATRKFESVMVDLETVGNVPGCGLLSIGAVQFDPMTGTLGAEHYEVVRVSTCYDVGLFAQESTLDWWAQQSDEAKVVLTQAGKKRGSVPIIKALDHFSEFLLKTTTLASNIKVWGCGSDFDNAILQVAYHKCNKAPPWSFWNNRCHRTLKALAPSIKAVRQGTYHNALDDAKTQAVHLAQIVKHLGLKL